MSIPAWVIALLIALFGFLPGNIKQTTTTSTKSATTTSTYSTETCVLNEETGLCDVITTNTGN